MCKIMRAHNRIIQRSLIKSRLLLSVTLTKALDCVNFFCVTLAFWPLTVTTHGGSRDQPCHQVWRPYEYSVIYHWKCVWRPFCFMQIIRWKLKIRLGNRALCIQHAWIMLKSLVSHFYPKMHLTCTILRNASRIMQVCISLQTDNHAITPPLKFLQAGCPSCRSTNSVKALKATKKSAKTEAKLTP